MHMVRHVDIGVYRAIKPFRCGAQVSMEALVVLVSVKDCVAIIAALDNMQRKTRNNNPGHAGHNATPFAQLR
jgi:hypothetical protein